MKNSNKILSAFRAQLAYNKKLAKPVPYRNRIIFGLIALAVSLFCFWIGEDEDFICPVVSVISLIAAIISLCKFIPLRMVPPNNDRKTLIKGFIFSFFVTCVCLQMITINNFHCLKSENVCVLGERHLWEKNFTTKSTIKLSSISAAYVEASKGKGQSFHVVLETDLGKENLTNSIKEKASIIRAKKINDFLNNKEEDLDIQDSVGDPLVFFLIILGFTVFILVKSIKK